MNAHLLIARLAQRLADAFCRTLLRKKLLDDCGGVGAANLPEIKPLRKISGITNAVWLRLFQVVSLVVGLSTPMAGRAQESFDLTEYQVKAAFLYRFCAYVEWPAASFSTPSSPIVIGIAGADGLLELMEHIVENRTVGGRSLHVQRIGANDDLNRVHMLFIAGTNPPALVQLVTNSRGLPTLIVMENEQGLDKGGEINFIVQDNRIRFDVDLDSSTRRGLRLSAQLLKVARTVRRESK